MFENINKKIQEFEYDFKNSMPYYPVQDYLKELKQAMSIDYIDSVEFKDFHIYVKDKCFNTIDFLLTECKYPPEDIVDKRFYIDRTVKQIKEYSRSAIHMFKMAFEYYKPTKKSENTL
jgi:hypothetical protein